MTEEKVKKFLTNFFGQKYKIIEATVTPLTKPNENYLSIMLKVDVRLKKDENSIEENLNLVAKCVKSSNDFVKHVFRTAFMNEILFYKETVPALQDFQRERGIEQVLDVFPKFYGGQMNKNNTTNYIDEDAIILLENLKTDGYGNIDRHLGFDMEGAKLILNDLSGLHATALGLKFSQTEVFEEKIRSNFRKAIPPPQPSDKERYKSCLNVLFSILADYEECTSYIPDLKQKFDKMREKINEFYDKPAREPFATLVHCDLWVNNMMQLVKNGKLIKNKFVDFQLVYYQSPVSDVLFFLWSSVQLDILKTNFDYLLSYYHSEFLEHLRKLNCNTSFFTLEKYLEEIDAVASSNFMDIIYMTMFVVFRKKDSDNDSDDRNVLKEDVPIAARDKIAYMVCEYGRRGWL